MGYYYEAALLSVLLVLVTNALFPYMESNIKAQRNNSIYLELKAPEQLNAFLAYLKEEYQIAAFHITPPQSGLNGHLGLEAELPASREGEIARICGELAQKEQVVFAVELTQAQ